ncbi:hypothetical protein [Photobacterium sp. OFAV2-7]|uniref:hypothetical protein n=1 Tax=Photobacterium sp. OFAV2-7 TaxID=2917748 RepID=UPI001EF4B804|nr:hypothetical protein [Photobacterium sp. OFAV2-7]MCG7586753.1 hypothetical protein [Photobacterium sp. OFAV2-7]
MSIPPHKTALKKRVNRFFVGSAKTKKSDKIQNARNRYEVSEFLPYLSEQQKEHDIYVFGGLVRDIALFGLGSFKSDVDLVFDGHKEELERALRRATSAQPNLTLIQNKFGGFRVKGRSWDIDIWCIEDTWAFKENFVHYTDHKSLLETTLLSWDSALYQINKKQLICPPSYLEDLAQGRLDIVLEHTPNELGSMVRICRAIYGKNASYLGFKAVKLIEQYFTKYSIKDILNYETQSYLTPHLNTDRCKKLASLIQSYNGEGDLDLQREKQLKLQFK